MAGLDRKGDDLFGIAKAFQARHVGWNVHDRIITNPHRTNNLAMPFPEYLIRVFRKGLQASERSHGEPPGPNGTACQRHVGCHQLPLPVFGNDGSFPAGTASGCYVPHLPTSACRFLHFVSFQICAPGNTLNPLSKFLPTGHLKRNGPWARNEMPARNARGNRRRGRAGICAIPAVKKNVRRSGMASGKKTFARRGALRSRLRNSRTRSADQVRQTAASIRVSGFTGPVLFAGGNTVIAGAGPCAMARAGGIARPRVSSGQMSGCRWLMTGLTCAGPVRPVTPPARPPQGRPGTTPWTALPCPPTAGRFHTGTFHTGTGVRQEFAGLHTATDRFLYPGNFSPVSPCFFP